MTASTVGEELTPASRRWLSKVRVDITLLLPWSSCDDKQLQQSDITSFALPKQHNSFVLVMRSKTTRLKAVTPNGSYFGKRSKDAIVQ